jgi:hypothetical protein
MRTVLKIVHSLSSGEGLRVRIIKRIQFLELL